MSTEILRPPGPKGRHILRSPLLGGAGPLVNLPAMVRRYGDTSFWRFLHISSYLFAHPTAVEAVLVTHHRSFSKGIGTRANPEIFGNGLLTSEGDFWLRQRRLSQPAFHRARIASYAEIMTQHVERMLNDWSDGQELDIHAEMMRLTLSIVTHTLFGVDISPKIGIISQALDAFIRQNSGLSIWQLILKVPTPKRLHYYRGVRQMDEIVYGIIGERRASHLGDDLLSDLLRAQDVDGSGMTDQQLRDEVMTMLLAGHETTALALTWSWYLLSQNPQTETRLHKELDEMLAGRVPTAEDVTRLQYANNVVRETMRIFPPAWIVTRAVTQPVEIAGYHVPAGSNVIISPWLTHRDSRWFPEPEKFLPDRWAADRASDIPKFAYFPFGGGPRICIGAGFAMVEAVLLLASIAQRYRIVLSRGQAIEPVPSITLRPGRGVRARVVRRNVALIETSTF